MTGMTEHGPGGHPYCQAAPITDKTRDPITSVWIPKQRMYSAVFFHSNTFALRDVVDTVVGSSSVNFVASGIVPIYEKYICDGKCNFSVGLPLTLANHPGGAFLVVL